MNTRSYRVSRSRHIAAHPSRVYAAIADYREQHPQIIPPQYFRRLEVLEGGKGAGTRTRVELCVLGVKRAFEQVVTEPEPGRVLAETNQDGSGVTTFTVETTDGGKGSQVTIVTDMVARPGVSGFLERLFTSVLLSRIYRKELARLADYVTRHRT